MKIHLISDLHQEAYAYYEDEAGKVRKRPYGTYDPFPGYTPPECDVVILAGDINEGIEGVCWAAETYKDVPVLYVPGNHEYYGYRQPEMMDHLRKACETTKNIIFMDRNEVIIDDVQFIGATLWTDFELFGNNLGARLVCEQQITDFRFIANSTGRLMTGLDVMEWHRRDRYFLSEAMLNKKGRAQVVITHFAPTERSAHPDYIGHNLSPYFASRMENLICDREPDVYVHGHMHGSADHMIWKTRILNNPRGNISSRLNKNFDPAFIFEV